jgi:hypothetical protein
MLANISSESNPLFNSTYKFSEHFKKIAFFLIKQAVKWFGRLASETLLGRGEYKYGSHFLRGSAQLQEKRTEKVNMPSLHNALLWLLWLENIKIASVLRTFPKQSLP